MVLGYTLDLRTHPVSYMLSRGIQASISSDDPGFFGYEGVTLDYVYAVGAWQLDMKDIKQLSLNGIKYSSVSKEVKGKVREAFDKDWQEWINFVIAESKLEEAGPIEETK
jgi:adenosine deaminase CECR1